MRKLPLSKERAKEILEKSHNGFFYSYGMKKPILEIMTDEEVSAVTDFWVKEGKGHHSFSDMIRMCARR